MKNKIRFRRKGMDVLFSVGKPMPDGELFVFMHPKNSGNVLGMRLTKIQAKKLAKFLGDR